MQSAASGEHRTGEKCLEGIALGCWILPERLALGTWLHDAWCTAATPAELWSRLLSRAKVTVRSVSHIKPIERATIAFFGVDQRQCEVDTNLTAEHVTGLPRGRALGALFHYFSAASAVEGHQSRVNCCTAFRRSIFRRSQTKRLRCADKRIERRLKPCHAP